MMLEQAEKLRKNSKSSQRDPQRNPTAHGTAAAINARFKRTVSVVKSPPIGRPVRNRVHYDDNFIVASTRANP